MHLCASILHRWSTALKFMIAVSSKLGSPFGRADGSKDSGPEIPGFGAPWPSWGHAEIHGKKTQVADPQTSSCLHAHDCLSTGTHDTSLASILPCTKHFASSLTF